MRPLRHIAPRWLLSLVLVLLTAAVALALNAGSLVRREIERRTDGRVLVGGLRIAPGSVTLHDVTITEGGYTVSCARIRAPLGITLEPLPLRSVRLTDCSLSQRSDLAPATPDSGEISGTEGQGVRSAIRRGLASAGEFTDEIELVRLTLDAGERGGGQLEHALLAVSSTGPQLRLTNLRFGTGERVIAVPDATLVLEADGQASVTSESPVTVADWKVHCAALQISPDFDRVQCADLELEHISGWLALRLLSAMAERDQGWALSVDSGTVELLPVAEGASAEAHQRLVRTVLERIAGRLGLGDISATAAASASGDETEASGAAAELEEATSPGVMACLEGADCWSPSPIAALLTRALDRVERWPEVRSQLLALERPEIQLEVTDLAVRLGGVELANVDRILLDGDRFELGAAAGELGFEVSTDLSTLSRIEVSASGVDLSVLGAWVDPDLSTRGRLSLDGTVSFDESVLRGEIRVAADEAGFQWDAISPEDIGLEPATITLDIAMGVGLEDTDVREMSRRVHADASLVYGGIEVQTSFRLRESERDDWTLQWRSQLAEEVSCARLWRAIPEGFVPNLGRRGVRFEGETGWVLTATYRFGDPWSFDPGSELFPGTCRVAWVTPEFDPEQLNSDLYVHHVTEGVEREDILVGPGTTSWVSMEALPAYVPAVMYLSEEMNFYNGVGISLNLIRRAVALNIHRSRYAYGGSTVMQQLVKNLFLSRAKTLSRKLEEAVLVWAMLERVEKDRILELYINCIEFAPDVYGIGAASAHYFGKAPQWLTPLEAIYLANLKPSPASAVNHYRRGHSPTRGWWQDRTRVMLQRLAQYTGSIHPDEVDYYAPYIVALTGSPAWESSGYQPIERPDWAVPGGSSEPPPKPEAKP